MTTGAALEARVQRLFLAQGLFAERKLWPSATPDRRMLATDVDVLVSEYASGFHLTRLHAECKGGKIAVLDRVLWLSGLRALLRADATYLVAADLDLDASQFATSLDVQLLTFKQLDSWESSLSIGADSWPCRSDLQAYEIPRERWQRISAELKTDEVWTLLREALAFIEIESWRTFRYRYVNKTFRLLESLAAGYPKDATNTDAELCSRYVLGSLLVRLSQLLLGICLDVSTVLPADLKKYLHDRLTFGDQDPAYAASLIQGTVQWITRAVQESGGHIPTSIDVGRLYAPPRYANELVELVERLLANSNDARYIAIASEVTEFGHSGIEQKMPRLRAAAAAGDGLAALLKGFVVRAFEIPAGLAQPVGSSVEALLGEKAHHQRQGRSRKTSGELGTRPRPGPAASTRGEGDTATLFDAKRADPREQENA